MVHLITPEEVGKYGRPISVKTDEDKLTAYIIEAEQMNVKPVLGDELFLSILEKGDDDEKFCLLLSVGTYSSEGKLYSFAGLKAALSYYVFAKYLMVGDFNATRFGITMKEDSYSAHISSAERSNAYSDTLEVANCYLQDCVSYCVRTGLMKGSPGNQKATGAVKIRKIGKI